MIERVSSPIIGDNAQNALLSRIIKEEHSNRTKNLQQSVIEVQNVKHENVSPCTSPLRCVDNAFNNLLRTPCIIASISIYLY